MPARAPASLRGLRGCDYDPDVVPEPELAGGVPCPLEPDPMLGQFLVELEPEPELPELDEPELELLEPELVLPELEVPVLPVLEPLLDDGVLVEEPELELVLGVELDVVAALATNAPPATRPVVNAAVASTLRKRMCMDDCLSSLVKRLPFGGYGQRAIPTCVWAQSDVYGWVELACECVTILRKPRRSRARGYQPAPGSAGARSACTHGSSEGWSAGSG